MQINENELIEIFSSCWEEEKEISEIRESVKNILNDFSKAHNINPKSLKAAYKLFCKYAEGKQDADESDDYSELSNIVDNYFNL